jgi:hypothetical protein
MMEKENAHTAESLVALPDRELDAVVAELVFGKIVIRSSGGEPHESFVRDNGRLYKPLRYSTTWAGMGDVIEKIGAKKTVKITYDYGKCLVEIGDVRINCGEVSRAVAIAAILVMQSMNEQQP